MNNLEKYLDQVIVEKPIAIESPQSFEGSSASDVMRGILRRWYIVLAIFVVLSGSGIPAIWRFIRPLYYVTGAINVAPIGTSLLGETEDYGGLRAYESFMNTQAEMIISGRVIQNVADDLKDKKLAFFEDPSTELAVKIKQTLNNTKIKPEPAAILKQAILDGIIVAQRSRDTELVTVTMKSTDPKEGGQIVDAFIRNYMAFEGKNFSDDKNRELNTLEYERGVLDNKLESQRAQVNQLAKEFGDANLATRHDMKLQRVGKLLATLTEIEARRIYLEAQVKLLENKQEESISLQELLKMREEYINKDPALSVLTGKAVELEQEILVAKQALAPGNPEIKRKEDLLEAMRTSLEGKRQQAGKVFDELISKEVAKAGNKKLANTQAEFEQAKAYEDQLRQVLAKEDTETIDLGRTQLMIRDLQDEMALTRELKDKLDRRTQELRMEQRRPGRVSKAFDADVSSIRDKRVKYTIAIAFAALVCGMGLAFLRDKADHSVRTAEDVTKRIGIRIIGTTTSSHTVKPSRLPEQVSGDYQTIRANLGLLNGSGMPRKLVIASPGMREGKTTFAINLALSMSRSGKKVLLIDGDLRKPDIASLLGLPKGSRGLQDLILAAEPGQSVCTAAAEGLDVLAADYRNVTDAFEVLASPHTAQRIDMISQNYDHVIIDTPPMLAFPDALIWAKIGDAVILTCFAGQTKAPDLKEAKKRLTQINVRVLGTVLSNVEAGQSYQRYGHDYYNRYARSGRDGKQARRRMLLPIPDANEATAGS